MTNLIGEGGGGVQCIKMNGLTHLWSLVLTKYKQLENCKTDKNESNIDTPYSIFINTKSIIKIFHKDNYNHQAFAEDLPHI